MLQDSASPHSNDEKCAALADAAWALLATHDIDKIGPVSYTHLTLPTILRV